jgi:hypothetical protein
LTLIGTFLVRATASEASAAARWRALGRVGNAVIGALGPELRLGSRPSRMCGLLAQSLRRHAHALVQLEAIHYQQSLLLFAAQTVDVRDVVPRLRAQFVARDVAVRGAAVACLRQLAQLDAALVVDAGGGGALEAALFAMLDAERDVALRSQLRVLIGTLLAATAPAHPSRWLELCKQLMQASARAIVKTREITVVRSAEDEDDEDGDGAADEPAPAAAPPSAAAAAAAGGDDVIVPRWWTKVFAMRCIAHTVRAVAASSDDASHWDLALARSSGNQEALALRLADLLGVAFSAATSPVAALRPRGIKLLRVVVARFAHAADPEYAGHFLLEQHAAQIAASLRAAFEADAAPELTAAACSVLAT